MAGIIQNMYKMTGMKKSAPSALQVLEKLPLGAMVLDRFASSKERWQSTEGNYKLAANSIHIIQVQRGCHEVNYMGKSFFVQKGFSYVANPQTSLKIVRRNDSTGFTEIRWLMLGIIIYRATDISSLLDIPLLLDRQTSAKFTPIMEEVSSWHLKPEKPAGLWATARECELGFRAVRLLCEISTCKPNWRDVLKGSDRIRNVLSYIKGNYDKKITLASMAERAELSPSRFRAIFCQMMKIPPMHYVRDFRLREAAHQLITTDASLRTLAEKIGFYDEFHFSREFKVYYRLSPSAYRQKYRY